MKPKALFLLNADAFADGYGEAERRALARLVDLSPELLTPDAWRRGRDALRDVEFLFSGWGTPRLDPEFLRGCPRLRAVFHAGGSVKSFVTDALWTRRVRVTSAAAANAVPVAEFAVAQIVFCLKHGWQRVREIRVERRFRKHDPDLPGGFGSTIGLLSLSRSGRLVAQALRRMDVRVIAYDPIVAPDDTASLGVRLCSLAEVFATADVVSCHMPLLPETARILGAAEFAAMKRGAAFINTARGSIVREAELIAVLASRPDLMAVLDVTDPEPPAADSPLFTLPNIVLTPHIAGSLGPECRRLGQMMVAETRRFLRGEPLLGEVTPAQLPRVA
jgi:phosphoglycerate dehydrogenase-like enzyme